MSDESLAKRYHDAMEALNRHITRDVDGTFIIGAKTAEEAGITDAILFDDLVRSVSHTNDLIRRGDLRPEDIEYEP